VNNFGKNLALWIIIGLLLVALFNLFQSSSSPGPQASVPYSEFVGAVESGRVNDVTIKGNQITGHYSDGRTFSTYAPEDAQLVQRLTESGVRISAQPDDSNVPSLFSILLSWFPMLLLIGVWIFFMRQMQGGGGKAMGFGKSKAKLLTERTGRVTFDDVAGIDEAKQELQEIVEFLKDPQKFQRLGGKIPKGVLLVGPPGTGKTLIARAVAGEANVPFFTISGSDFVEMFVGVGASRVRDLFKQAKENSPCIIFLDEIDAVGRRRGGGFTTGGHDEREQTLNAILVEMDGFETSDQVIVIAATNRRDVLDPALTRPGRFDRSVEVSLPDVKGRMEILQVHASKVKFGPDVDLERIARGTPMFSGADLAAIINEAAIMATMSDKEFIEHEDLEEARDKVKFGRQRKSRVIEEEERVATAYHEAGHAVLQVLLPNSDPLHKVTIIPRGEYGGASMSLPEKDRHGFGLKWLQSMMRMACGGRIAEQIKTGDVSSGAAADIAQVTRIARTMILEWGMSEKLGFVRYSSGDGQESLMHEREYSDETASLIDEEVKRLSDEAYTEAEDLLRKNWEKVERVAQALLKYETLTADEVERLMRGESLAKPTVSDLLAAEASREKSSEASSGARNKPEDEGPAPGVVPSPA